MIECSNFLCESEIVETHELTVRAALVVLPGANNRVLSEIAPNIIAQAQSGNEDAFHAIYRRYGRPIASFLYHHVNNRALAEELAQETFVRAYRNLNFLKDEARLSTWLFGIARNVAREASRKNLKDERNITLDEPESLRLKAGGRNPDGAMLDRELNQTIKTGISRAGRRQANRLQSEDF